jgi:hypothetical protein
MPATRGPLAKAVDGLKRALAGDVAAGGEEWAGGFGRALAAVEQAVRRHRATLEDGEGRVVDVNTSLNPSPTVDRRAGELRQELDGFLREAQALRGKLHGVHAAATKDPSTLAGALPVAPQAADLGVFCERAERLVEGLGQFDREEADLIQESVTLDLGAGD